MAEKKRPGGDGTNQHTRPKEQCSKDCHIASDNAERTHERLARELKVSPRTIQNDAEFAEAIDTLAEIGNRQGERTDLDDESTCGKFSTSDSGKKTRKIVAEKAGFGNETTFRQAEILDNRGAFGPE